MPAKRQKEGRDGSNCLCLSWLHFLGPKAHAETGEVAVGKGEGSQEDDEPRVVLEGRSPALAGLDVTQPQQGHEHQPGQHQAWQSGHMDTAVRLLPSQSKTLKVKKQDVGMKESPRYWCLQCWI